MCLGQGESKCVLNFDGEIWKTKDENMIKFRLREKVGQCI